VIDFTSVLVVTPQQFWEVMGRAAFIRTGAVEGFLGRVMFVTYCAPEKVTHIRANRGKIMTISRALDPRSL